MRRATNSRAGIMSALTLALLLGLVMLGATACEPSNPGPTTQSGAIDLIPTTQSTLALADEDLHPVGADGKMGYIDGKGTVVIEPQFQRAETFSEGLAQAGAGDSPFSCRWGYVDKTGEWVIE
jgi:hypothetical protein